MRDLLKRSLFALLTNVGLPKIYQRRNRRKLVVLMYHGIIRDGQPNWASRMLVRESAFREQIKYLHEAFEVIPLSQAPARLSQKSATQKPLACITFDDGYENNCSIALDILREYNAPATIFLATGAIGTGEVHWTLHLMRACVETKTRRLDLMDLGMGTHQIHRLPVHTHDLLKTLLYRLPEARRTHVLSIIFDRLGYVPKDRDFADFRMMNWEEARIANRTGLMEFGGHSVSHMVLSAMENDTLEREVKESLAKIKRELGYEPKTFSYPNGTRADFDERSKKALCAAGVNVAVSTIEGLNDSSTDKLELRRMPVDDLTTLNDFKLRISGVVEGLRRIGKWLGIVSQEAVLDPFTPSADSAEAPATSKVLAATII